MLPGGLGLRPHPPYWPIDSLPSEVKRMHVTSWSLIDYPDADEQKWIREFRVSPQSTCPTDRRQHLATLWSSG